MVSGLENYRDNYFLPAVYTTGEYIQKGITCIDEHLTSCDRKIVAFTDAHLPHTAAIIAQTAARVLPLLAVQLLLPFWGQLLTATAFTIYKYVAAQGRKEGATVNLTTLKNAAGFTNLFLGARDIAVGVVTNTYLQATIGAIKMLIGTFFLFSSGLVREVFKLPEPKIEEVKDESEKEPSEKTTSQQEEELFIDRDNLENDETPLEINQRPKIAKVD